MLDYRINTFLTLYDQMNYRKTAQILNMTQPGVTQHIQYLEKYYGIKLFKYDGHTLSSTKNAEKLKIYLDSVKAEEKALFEAFADSEMVNVSLGATKTIGEFVISSQIRSFLSVPSNNLVLTIDNTEILLNKLEKSEIDFAIIEGIFDKSKYGYHPFKKEKFVGVCSKNHPFANKTLLLEDIFNEDLIVREPFSGTRSLLENAVHEHGFSFDNFRRCISVSNFSVICDLVANNNAITFCYEPISLSRDDLSVFTVSDLTINGEFNFVYCNKRLAEEKIRLFFS